LQKNPVLTAPAQKESRDAAAGNPVYIVIFFACILLWHKKSNALYLAKKRITKEI
jgi:hypothetical protein